MNSKNIVWHNATVTRNRRESKNGHKSVIIWFTGLSASGKSTLAHALEEKLYGFGCSTFVLDGDNVRHGLNFDLGFSEKDRTENIRRIGEMSKLFMEAGIIVMNAFISPFKNDRDRIRGLVPHGDFFEIFCKCPIEVCETRDVKGLYKKARRGEIKDFTGISSPYEAPENPDLEIETSTNSVDDCVLMILDFLKNRGVITKS